MGPTGSGKTGVAIKIAKAVGGEIISADSRAIYKGMDIGTAKPTIAERAGIPHFGFDLVEPGERFTVADFKQYTLAKIEEIKGREKVPIIVGGTGLYIDALVYDYQFKVNKKSVQAGQERGSIDTAPDRKSVNDAFFLVGVKWETEKLRERLKERLNKIFVQELFDETAELVKKYGWSNNAMTGNVYKFAWRYMQGELGLDEAKQLSFYEDWHLAKRQMTWFKRNDQINWMGLEKVYPFVLKYIQYE